MKFHQVMFFFSLLLVMSCTKKEDPITDSNQLNETNLVGDWQVVEFINSNGETASSTGLTFGLYCDAIILRSDQTFGTYYQNNEEDFDKSRVDGTWSFEDSKLKISYGGSFEVSNEVLEFDANSLTLHYSWLDGLFETAKLKKIQ